MALFKQLPEEVRSNDNYTLEKLQKKSFLTFLVSHMQGTCLDKIF